MEHIGVIVGAVISVLVTLAWCLLQWWNHVLYIVPLGRRCSNLPPGNMGLPFLGETLTFLWYFKFIGRPDEYIHSKRRMLGDNVPGLYRTHLLGKPSVIACSAEAIKFILQSEEIFRLKWPSVELVGKNSLIAARGEAHVRVRKFLIRGINTPQSLRQITLMIQPRVISALQSWAQVGRITAYDEVKKVTMANTGKYFAGFEPGKVLDTLSTLFHGLLAGVRAFPINIPGTAHHHALQCRKKATKIFAQEMELRKKSGEIGKNDLMEGLMHMKDENGNQLSETEVLDNIVSLVVAGYESTTTAITWAFYFLAKHRNVLQKLREEHINLASQKEDGALITYDDILTCKYTSKVVEETIRLANISSFLFRTASKDVQFQGYTLPKGWTAICWLRYVHTNPENFDDPMCFNPDRWNERPKPGTQLMFGTGPRLCPGNMLARLQLSIMLHYLSTGYSWELVNPDAKIVYLPHPKPEDGVKIHIRKIHKF